VKSSAGAAAEMTVFGVLTAAKADAEQGTTASPLSPSSGIRTKVRSPSCQERARSLFVIASCPADNTDTYAFVSPDDAGTVTLITNYLPLEPPFGGPNFYEFGDDVRYDIYVDNDGDGRPDVTYEFMFETAVADPDTYLYNTGPIDSINSANWNRRQFYTVTKHDRRGRREVLGSGLACPPCKLGRRQRHQRHRGQLPEPHRVDACR
jgi:hypothetical protein